MATRPEPVRQDKKEGERTSVVRELRPSKHDASKAEARAAADTLLVADVRSGSPAASALLFDRYATHVERLLFSLLGPENEIEDLLHEVFVRAFEGIGDLEDPGRLRSWLTGIAVHTAREWIRRRVRRRWLRFVEELPDPPSPPPNEEANEATRCAFEVLNAMSTDDRVIFSLRFIEGMEMGEVAVACDMSLSTAKRRLKDAEKHFLARARRFPPLRPWIEEGGRWASE